MYSDIQPSITSHTERDSRVGQSPGVCIKLHNGLLHPLWYASQTANLRFHFFKISSITVIYPPPPTTHTHRQELPTESHMGLITVFITGHTHATLPLYTRSHWCWSTCFMMNCIVHKIMESAHCIKVTDADIEMAFYIAPTYSNKSHFGNWLPY